MTRGIREDLTGKKFSMLEVLEKDCSKNRVHYFCLCDCGNKKSVRADSLKNGNTKSCGCLGRHGKLDSPVYSHWSNMKNRCLNKNAINSPDYGERGIEVCKEWQDSFVAFEEWALENGFEVGLTLDRIDVNGNYEPKNCRWADMKTQGRNKRNNVLLTYKEETHCLNEWAEILGMNTRTIQSRYARGWSVEDIIEKPVRK